MSNSQRDEYQEREYAIAWRDDALQGGERVAGVEQETQNLVAPRAARIGGSLVCLRDV